MLLLHDLDLLPLGNCYRVEGGLGCCTLYFFWRGVHLGPLNKKKDPTRQHFVQVNQPNYTGHLYQTSLVCRTLYWVKSSKPKICSIRTCIYLLYVFISWQLENWSLNYSCLTRVLRNLHPSGLELKLMVLI